MLGFEPSSFVSKIDTLTTRPNEIRRRINLASSAFGRLCKRVLENQIHTTNTKIAVYDAVVVSTILCGCETWVPYRRHIRLAESFHIRRLQYF